MVRRLDDIVDQKERCGFQKHGLMSRTLRHRSLRKVCGIGIMPVRVNLEKGRR